jgi:DUF4097 and DUF4098 domain-containing protein YvlB
MFSDNVTNAPTCSQPSNTSTGSSQSNVDADNIDNTTVAGDVRCSGQEGAEREVSVIDCLDNAANTATADSGVGNVQKEGIRYDLFIQDN